MQIVENWSDVEGEVKKLLPNPSDPSITLATIAVEAATPVASFPNLLAGRVGNEITVGIATAAVQRSCVAPGHRVHLRIRQAGPEKFFSHPDHVEKVA